MGGDLAIRMHGVWKRFGLPLPAWVQRAYQRLSGVGESGRPAAAADDRRWVLRDINLEVRRGETLAVIGRNGAAKSTLLKILAGVTPPTRGCAEVRGRVFPMIELTGGLHQELTGRENIRLIGAIIGLSRREVSLLMPAIEAFTELGPWLDQPVRAYSTGMLARLGFGVGACITSDVVLIDEALAVGDLSFQNKCLARIREMHEHGAAIVVVTHSLDTAQFIAQRGVVLDGGRIVASGSSLEALRAYEQLVFGGGAGAPPASFPGTAAAINGARLYGIDDHAGAAVPMGAPFGIEIDCRLPRAVRQPLFAIAIVNAAGVTCVSNLSSDDALHRSEVGGRVRLRAWYAENHLMKGHYRVDVAIQDGTSFQTVDQRAGVTSFAVIGPGRARGLVAMAPRWELSACGD